MLPKYPFTPDGVKNKIAQIYALDDTNLAIQANAVKDDFRSWMSDNFDLTTKQQTYLTALDNRATEYDGTQLYFCFLYRLGVILIQEAEPETEDPYDKNTSTENTVRSVADDNGKFEMTGTFIFNIFYEPTTV